MAGSQASGSRMLGSFNIVTLLYSRAKKKFESAQLYKSCYLIYLLLLDTLIQSWKHFVVHGP